MRRFAPLLHLILSCTILSAQQLTNEMTRVAFNLYDAVTAGQQQLADSLADCYLALCTSEEYQYGLYYAEAKHVKAHTAADRGDFLRAKQIMDEVIAVRLDKRTASNDERLGYSYFDRGKYYSQLKIIDKAICRLQPMHTKMQKKIPCMQEHSTKKRYSTNIEGHLAMLSVKQSVTKKHFLT